MVFGVGQLNYAIKFGSDNFAQSTRCHGNENSKILTENLPLLRLHCISDSRNFDSTVWFSGLALGNLNHASEIWIRQTLVAMVTKIWKFEYKITIIQLAYPLPSTVKQQI